MRASFCVESEVCRVHSKLPTVRSKGWHGFTGGHVFNGNPVRYALFQKRLSLRRLIGICARLVRSTVEGTYIHHCRSRTYSSELSNSLQRTVSSTTVLFHSSYSYKHVLILLPSGSQLRWLSGHQVGIKVTCTEGQKLDICQSNCGLVVD